MDAQRIWYKRRYLGLIICLIGVSGCATVNLPEVTDQSYSLEEDENRLMNRAKEAVDYYYRSDLIYKNEKLEKYLNDQLKKLLPDTIFAENLDFKIEILKDSSLNAAALTNGRIYINTGFLAAIDNEAQLVTILSHEISHVLKRHHIRKQRNADNKATFYNITLGGVAPSIYGLATASSISGFSQDQEKEADEEAANVLIKHGYDLKEGTRVYEILESFFKLEKIKKPLFFSTHPKTKNRIKYYEKRYEEYQSESPSEANKKIGQKEYQSAINEVYFETIEAWISESYYKFAEKSLKNYLSQAPNSEKALFLKGELLRQRHNAGKKKNDYNKSEDRKSAIQVYDQVIALNRNFGKAYLGKGRVLQSLGKTKEAKENFRRYLTLEPDAKDRAYIERYIDNE